MRPLIGITGATHIDEQSGLTYSRAYQPIVEAVTRAGGLPVVIPPGLDEETARAIYERLDGVLLPGGPDIDPAYYGEDAHPTVKIDAARDQLEVPLVRWAVADDVPLFGICRGHQVVNVALGGTLIQDISSQVESTTLTHDTPRTQPRHAPAHEVRILPDSRLAAIVGGGDAPVNSLHHQAVERPAPGMVVAALSEDGLVEATEMPDKRFVLTVQWHPEDMVSRDDVMRPLFAEFVEAARVRALARA